MSAEVGFRNTYYNGALILIDFTIKNTILLNNIGLYLHVLFGSPLFDLSQRVQLGLIDSIPAVVICSHHDTEDSYNG